MDLIFINAGLKTDGAYYRDMLLTQKLLPAICEICAVFFTFNSAMLLLLRSPSVRDSQPSGTTDSVPLYSIPLYVTFIVPNSTDLNPLDYKMARNAAAGLSSS